MCKPHSLIICTTLSINTNSTGNIAAFNMMNAEQPTYIDSVPFFWTVLFGKSIRYSGW